MMVALMVEMLAVEMVAWMVDEMDIEMVVHLEVPKDK
jgi:hypothetical protein